MGAIQFRTTPKGDLPHYYYIFRKTEPLGKKYEECGMPQVGENVAPRDTKGEGGYEDFGISKIYWR